MYSIRFVLFTFFVANLSFAMEDSDERAFMLVHGLSSSNYEWTEAADYIKKNCPRCVVTLVSLDKHASVEELRSSTWQQWGETMVETYQKLSETYADITVVLSSAAAALFLENISSIGSIFAKGARAPRKVVFVDPFMIPQSNFLWAAPYLQWLPYKFDQHKADLTDEERANSLDMVPIEAIAQLQQLRSIVTKRLEAIIALPAETAVEILCSNGDPKVAANNGVYLQSHLSALYVSLAMYPSSLHVFTRLRGRAEDVITEQDKINQADAFKKILAPVIN